MNMTLKIIITILFFTTVSAYAQSKAHNVNKLPEKTKDSLGVKDLNKPTVKKVKFRIRRYCTNRSLGRRVENKCSKKCNKK